MPDTYISEKVPGLESISFYVLKSLLSIMSNTRSLLFVDDYDMLRKIYAEILTDAGYRVMEAASAEECMQSLTQEVPDMILLDIMMKPVDGWQTLRQIRSYPPSSTVPVVMISGKAILPSEVTRYGPMIDGFMRKPLQNAALLSSLDEYFSWLDTLKTICDNAIINGADSEIISSYSTYKRQEKGVNIMLALIQREYDISSDLMAVEIISESIQEIKDMIETIGSKISQARNAIGSNLID